MAVVYNFATPENCMNQGADFFANFIYNQPALITNITSDGTTVTFTATNGFVAGQTVSISGVLPNQFNFQNVEVASSNGDEFEVLNPATGIYISGGLAYAPVNLDNSTAALQLRSLPTSQDAVLTLTTENGGIGITGLTGNILVHATAEQTRAIDEGYYYYDLEVTQLGGSPVTTRIAQGQILVSAEITR